MITKKKKLTAFRPKVFSRHPSHSNLRSELPLFRFRSVIRLGSTTSGAIFKPQVEINSIQGVINSANKFLMKQCFNQANIKTADWYTFNSANSEIMFLDRKLNASVSINDLPYPILSKHIHGSRGTGNVKHNTPEELKAWMVDKDLSNYIFEKFYTYFREYRLHVTENGCFYTCRKMLKNDTPENKRFQRHDDNCVWILQDNEKFDEPINFNDIIQDCVKALKQLGLDIGAFDVKVQSATNSKGQRRKSCEYIIIESCSAPSFGTLTHKHYLQQLTNLIILKWKEMK